MNIKVLIPTKYTLICVPNLPVSVGKFTILCPLGEEIVRLLKADFPISRSQCLCSWELDQHRLVGIEEDCRCGSYHMV